MKFRQIVLLPILGLIILASATLPNYLQQKNEEKERLLVKLVVEGLQELHYEPQALNDDFSERVYDLYMKRLDNGKRFLTQADVKKLAKYQTELDNEVKEGSLEF